MLPAPPAPPDRRIDRALGLVVVLLAATMTARSYGGRAALRPTDHLPPAVASTADLNRADRAELLQVPGIGPHLADAILTHRAGTSFTTVDDLRRVKGIGPATLDKLRPWVSVESPTTAAELRPVETLERKPSPPPPATRGGKLKPGDPPLDLNAASEADLQRLPGVGPTLAARIVLARGAERFKAPDDLRRVKGIGVKTLDNLRPYVVCRQTAGSES